MTKIDHEVAHTDDHQVARADDHEAAPTDEQEAEGHAPDDDHAPDDHAPADDHDIAPADEQEVTPADEQGVAPDDDHDIAPADEQEVALDSAHQLALIIGRARHMPATNEDRDHRVAVVSKGVDALPDLPEDRSKIWHSACQRIHAPEFCRGPLCDGILKSCVLCGEADHITDDCEYWKKYAKEIHHLLELYLYVFARQALPQVASRKSFQYIAIGKGNKCLVAPLSPVTAKIYEQAQFMLDRTMHVKLLYHERFGYGALQPVNTELNPLPPPDRALGGWMHCGPLANDPMPAWLRNQYEHQGKAVDYQPKWTLFANEGCEKPNPRRPHVFPEWVLTPTRTIADLQPQLVGQEDEQEDAQDDEHSDERDSSDAEPTIINSRKKRSQKRKNPKRRKLSKLANQSASTFSGLPPAPQERFGDVVNHELPAVPQLGLGNVVDDELPPRPRLQSGDIVNVDFDLSPRPRRQFGDVVSDVPPLRQRPPRAMDASLASLLSDLPKPDEDDAIKPEPVESQPFIEPDPLIKPEPRD